MKLTRYITLFILILFTGGMFSQFVAVKTNDKLMYQLISQKNYTDETFPEKGKFFNLNKYYNSLLATNNKQIKKLTTKTKPVLNFLSEKFLKITYLLQPSLQQTDKITDSYTQTNLPYSFACKYYVFALRKIII